MKIPGVQLISLSFSLCGLAAADTLSYANGDLFLCFRQVGNAEEYLVKLGPSSNFTSVTGTITVSGLGNIAADLEDTFGADWHSTGDVSWSVSGASGISGANGEPARTIFATKSEVLLGTLETAWERSSTTTQSAPDSKMRTMGNSYAGSPAHSSTANSSVGYRQSTGATGSYTSYQSINPDKTLASSFSYFPGGIEGKFTTGADSSALDLFRMKPGSGLGDFLGTFKITAAGVLTFSNQAAFDAKVTTFTRVGQTATLIGTGTPNAPYRIQRSTDLGSWTTLTTPTVLADPSGVITFIDPASPAGRAYYRIAAP